MYAMFAVINDTKKVKKIIKMLSEIGIKGATVIDTMGGGKYCSSYLSCRPAVGSALRSVSDTKIFNKTIFSIIYCEKHVLEAMELIENILGGDMKKADTGIAFTIPVEDFRGGELGKYLKACE